MGSVSAPPARARVCAVSVSAVSVWIMVISLPDYRTKNVTPEDYLGRSALRVSSQWAEYLHLATRVLRFGAAGQGANGV
ncbi:hypothetical protein GCM10011359_14540 [Nesterenkonia alkaliphila]|nr:hypothetical protein GCM10011359_14540 [Nesterenkonia alkaliphila]